MENEEDNSRSATTSFNINEGKKKQRSLNNPLIQIARLALICMQIERIIHKPLNFPEMQALAPLPPASLSLYPNLKPQVSESQ